MQDLECHDRATAFGAGNLSRCCGSSLGQHISLFGDLQGTNEPLAHSQVEQRLAAELQQARQQINEVKQQLVAALQSAQEGAMELGARTQAKEKLSAELQEAKQQTKDIKQQLISAMQSAH